VSGYLITSLQANLQPLPPKAEWGWWYQYYFATERGKLGYSKNCNDFNKLIWKNVSPKWDFDDATFDRTAASFKNPKVPLSLCPESPSLAISTVRPRTEHPIPTNSRANIRTES
jgi:hypothetical protein